MLSLQTGSIERDFLDEITHERTARNPRFPKLVAKARRRPELSQDQAERPQAPGPRQTAPKARKRRP